MLYMYKSENFDSSVTVVGLAVETLIAIEFFFMKLS